MSDATGLTAEQLNDLRAAARGSGPFIDPAAFRAVQAASFHAEWAAAVLGHPYPGLNRVERWEITLLASALAAEPDRPVPAAELARQEAYEREQREQRRAEAQRAADRLTEWHALRAHLPVPVTVGHNWTIGHYDGHVAGKDHIVVQARLNQGRLHRRAQQVLCETPAKTRSQTSRSGTNEDPLRGVDRTDDGQDRVPTCAACLKIAERVADRADYARLLTQGRAAKPQEGTDHV